MPRLAISSFSPYPSACGARPRRTVQFAPRCDDLETRQLLSIVSMGPPGNVLVGASVAGAQVTSSTAASGVNLAGNSSAVAQIGVSNGQSGVQPGSILSQLGLPSSPNAANAVSTAQTVNPTVTALGLNLPFANLPITVLNPVETSVAAAIIDTQVDADAYLVPSTTELLESYLGVRTTPGSQVGSMFSELLAAGTTPGVTNVNGTAIADTSAPGSSVVSLRRNPVSSRGQSAIPGINSSLQGSSSADEPIEPAAAGAPAPAQQAPAVGQPQVPAQQAPPG